MNYLFVIGGVALVAIILLAIYEAYRLKHNEEPESISDLVNDMADDRLAVDYLDSHDLTSWFRTKNSDGKKKGVLIYPNEADMTNYKLPNSIKLGSDKIIIQALLDDSDNIVLCRSVMFTSMNPTLEKLFHDNEGVIIVE